MINSILFFLTAIFLIIFAITAVCAKNVIYSLLSAIVVFFLAGLIFYLLGSEYNAVIQIAIYGLAVPIIIGLSVMFTNSKTKDKNIKKDDTNLKYLLILISCLFIMSLIYLILTSLTIVPEGFLIQNSIENNFYTTMDAFINGIYVNYVYTFEAISLILTIVVVGLVLFNKEVKS